MSDSIPKSFNEWFCNLEPGRQAVLREDKWMLADTAFRTGLDFGLRLALLGMKTGGLKITDDMIFAAQASYLGDVDGSGRISDEQMKQAIIAALAAMK